MDYKDTCASEVKQCPLTTTDYLFFKYRAVHIKLSAIRDEFFGHISLNKLFEKARNSELPISCYRLDDSQKCEWFVHLYELAEYLDKIYLENYKVYEANKQHQSKKGDWHDKGRL